MRLLGHAYISTTEQALRKIHFADLVHGVSYKSLPLWVRLRRSPGVPATSEAGGTSGRTGSMAGTSIISQQRTSSVRQADR